MLELKIGWCALAEMNMDVNELLPWNWSRRDGLQFLPSGWFGITIR